MARTFVRLKLRLLRNGLHIGQAGVLFAIGATAAAVIALVGFSILAAARGDASAPNVAVVGEPAERQGLSWLGHSSD